MEKSAGRHSDDGDGDISYPDRHSGVGIDGSIRSNGAPPLSSGHKRLEGDNLFYSSDHNRRHKHKNVVREMKKELLIWWIVILTFLSIVNTWGITQNQQHILANAQFILRIVKLLDDK